MTSVRKARLGPTGSRLWIGGFVAFLSAVAVIVLVQSVEAESKAEGKHLSVAGINAGWQDFSPMTTALAFTNVIHNATRWQGSGFELDENGYPKALDEGQEATLSVFKHNGRHYPLGDYLLVWEGEGNIEIRSAGKSIRFGPKDIKRQIVPIDAHSDYGIQIALSSVPASNPIQNLRFYLPGYDETSGNWTDHYKKDVAPYGMLRYMWGSGVWSCIEVSEWEERRKPSDYHWLGGDEALGIPYEAMIELANETKSDLWVCAPHRASEDYMRRMAALFRDQLDPSLSFWIEYTNEHWLDIEIFKIPPNDYLQEEIAANQGVEDYRDLTVSQLYARKSARLFEIFTDVFAEKGQEDRLNRVICGCASASIFLEEAADEFARLGKMHLIDAMGIGPYFRPNEGDERFLESLDQGWEAIFQAVHATLDDMFDPNGLVGSEMYANAAVAVKYDKPLVTYEAGQHYTTWTNTPSGIIAPMNRRPEMYSVYKHFLEEWGGMPNASTMTFFQAVSLYNHEEAFGLREYYDQPESELHKRRAALDWLVEKRREDQRQ